jgi:acetoin utilization deacetylase AcuC-like enzyme
MTTRLYTNDIFVEHATPPGHPERAERVRAVRAALDRAEFAALDRLTAPKADETAVLLVHPPEHLAAIKRLSPTSGIARVDSDTVMSPHSIDAALHGVGAAMAAVDDVFSAKADNVFICSRPPGHHAEKNRAMGFCLFANAAIAARHAQKAHGAERVAIVDWDVHHGNGTQDIFWDDPSVLFCSTHQMPLFPGSGAKTETGANDDGHIVNAPLSEGDGADEFKEAFQTRILPAIDAFKPDLILISAGFDAHYRDPLGGINLTEDDFDWATGQLLDRADRYAKGRLVSLLEGGYDLIGLANSAAAHVSRLMRG